MRNTKVITLGPDAGRDKSKTFLITEMSATKAERWAMRALLLAAQSGAEIPRTRGMAALALISIQTIMGGVQFDAVEPLLDEMFGCVQIIPDLQKFPNVVRPLIEDDIEEPLTRLRLREEVLSLHLGFSFADALSTLMLATSATQANSSITQTSPKTLA